MPEHEKINYLEFPSQNLSASKAFFTKVFNWSFNDFGAEYSAFNGAGIDGGLFKAEQSASTDNGSALIVFYSQNLEQTLDKVIAAEGRVVQQIFSFPGGRRFHFTEPGGSEFAVWSDRGGSA